MAAAAGAIVLAIDEAPRPYGELESSVPAWHVAMVGSFMGRIDENLTHPNIKFVPRTTLGRDVTFEALSALGVTVVDATGRGHSSPPALAGGLELSTGLRTYGELVHWFNLRGHLAWPGPDLELPAHVAVIGSDLAAFDAARLVSIELHRRALAERGHVIGPEALAREGIAPTLARLGVSSAKLGITAVSLVVAEGLDALLRDAPSTLRGAAIDALKTRDLVNLLPGFEVGELVASDSALTTLNLVNAHAEGFAMSLPCELLIDARTQPATGSALSDVFARFEPALIHKLWEARLAPARSDEAAIARGEVLAEAVGSAVRELIRPVVEQALTAPCPAGTTERAAVWAKARQEAVGFADYGEWMGQTRRRWLY